MTAPAPIAAALLALMLAGCVVPPGDCRHGTVEKTLRTVVQIDGVPMEATTTTRTCLAAGH